MISTNLSRPIILEFNCNLYLVPLGIFHHCLDIRTGSHPYCAQILFTNIRVGTVMPLTMVKHLELF